MCNRAAQDCCISRRHCKGKMAGDGFYDNFEKLEDAVKSLLNRNDGLLKENGFLTAALDEKEREVKALKEKISALRREKGAVKDKVDVLLGRLDGLV
ncbi:MAG: cell division protein ZapB [Deltaproteobacteria bacterium]|nr:cell division protein ZapB [Deltaproteobacteria bacterium]